MSTDWNKRKHYSVRYLDVTDDGQPVNLPVPPYEDPYSTILKYLHALEVNGLQFYIPKKLEGRRVRSRPRNYYTSGAGFGPNSPGDTSPSTSTGSPRPLVGDYAFVENCNDSVEERLNKRMERRAEQRKLLMEGFIGICTSATRYSIVRDTAQLFDLLEVEQDLDWNLLWIDIYLPEDRASTLRPFQIVNHLPHTWQICRKDLLCDNLRRLYNKFPADFIFVPATWCLPDQSFDLIQFAKRHRENAYIFKPENGCQGRGIEIYKSILDISPLSYGICQVYISDPFLIDDLKFDMRLYVLLISVDPLRIYVYNDGIARFATVKYVPPQASHNTSNSFMHLTNYSVNRHSSKYIADDEECGSKRKISTVFKWMRDQGHNTALLTARIDDLIIKTIISGLPYMKRAYNIYFPQRPYACFEILGFDVMIDKKLRPFLIEVNHSPSFHMGEIVDEQIKRSLIADTFGIINLDRLKSETFLSFEDCYKDAIDSQFDYELKNCGDYRLVYPSWNARNYDKFMFERVQYNLGSTVAFKFVPFTPKLPALPTKYDKSSRSPEEKELKKKIAQDNAHKLIQHKKKFNVQRPPVSRSTPPKQSTIQTSSPLESYLPHASVIGKLFSEHFDTLYSPEKGNNDSQVKEDPVKTTLFSLYDKSDTKVKIPLVTHKPPRQRRPVSAPPMLTKRMEEYPYFKPTIYTTAAHILKAWKEQEKIRRRARKQKAAAHAAWVPPSLAALVALQSSPSHPSTDAEISTDTPSTNDQGNLSVEQVTVENVSSQVELHENFRPKPIIYEEEMARVKAAAYRRKYIDSFGIPLTVANMFLKNNQFTPGDKHYCDRNIDYWCSMGAMYKKIGRKRIRALSLK